MDMPRFYHHYSHTPLSEVQYEHAGHSEYQQEALISPVSRHGNIVPLKLGAEEVHLEELGNAFQGQQHSDTPLSPTATKVSPVSADGQGFGMAFSESPWESMEWLDLTPPSSATAFSSSSNGSGMASSVPSIFNTEFLDMTDIGLNSAMDLHLEHW